MVALRKESVDRNKKHLVFLRVIVLSLSARRAWIEMLCSKNRTKRYIGRSPQGERG